MVTLRFILGYKKSVALSCLSDGFGWAMKEATPHHAILFLSIG